jgi:hypothetical protein
MHTGAVISMLPETDPSTSIGTIPPVLACQRTLDRSKAFCRIALLAYLHLLLSSNATRSSYRHYSARSDDAKAREREDFPPLAFLGKKSSSNAASPYAVIQWDAPRQTRTILTCEHLTVAMLGLMDERVEEKLKIVSRLLHYMT